MEKEKTYRIKSLPWTRRDQGTHEAWVAYTDVVNYYIGPPFGCLEGLIWGYEFHLEHCFSRSGKCRSIEDGKAAAETHWNSIGRNFVEEVD